MASRYGFDEAKIARFHKEGRGQGFGADYKPWVTVRDVPSRGRSHRLLGAVTGRIHHLLSDIERSAVLIYDFRDDVRDIREQFPLDIEQTQSIAESAGIRHPVDSQTRIPLVQTTDLLIDLDVGGRIITIARTVKSADSLSQPRNIEKLEIERRYWTDRGISWGIITDREIPLILIRNLELLQGYATLDNLTQPFEGYFQEKANMIAAELESWPDTTLHEFCNAADSRLGLETGASLMIVRHLLAAKIWRVDMMQPISEAMPMAAFTRTTSKQNRRAQA